MPVDDLVKRGEGAALSSAPSPSEEETRKAIHTRVLALAWPLVLANMLQTLNGFQDRFFVGHLGPHSLAAAGVGSQLMFVLFGIAMSLSVGATALVARFRGANDLHQARLATNQVLWLAGVTSFICIAVIYPIRAYVVQIMHLDAAATELCVRYVGIALLGMPGLFVMMNLSSAYRGIGDMKTPLLVTIAVNLVHFTGNVLLVRGNFGFPALGLAGGAMALVASQYMGAVACILLLRRTPLRGSLRVASRPSKEWAQRILKIGIPALWQNMSRIFSMLAFTNVLAHVPYSTEAVAALTIGLTSESIAFMPGFAFSMAASTLTGQALGARDPRRAEQSALVALQQGIVVMIVMGLVFFIFARPFAHIFSDDARVVDLTVSYLRIAAISEPFLALGMILTGALNGAGETSSPAWASVFSMWAVRLGLAYALITHAHMGAVGGWWAMSLSTVVGGIAAYGLFRWIPWKEKKV